MTAQQPLVSVIIASYNHGRYIEESILSVLGQTYPNIELLVVDDGSKDDSVERIQRLQAEHGFDFQVQQNQGLTATLNGAIARAKGSLIARSGRMTSCCRTASPPRWPTWKASQRWGCVRVTSS